MKGLLNYTLFYIFNLIEILENNLALPNNLNLLQFPAALAAAELTCIHFAFTQIFEPAAYAFQAIPIRFNTFDPHR